MAEMNPETGAARCGGRAECAGPIPTQRADPGIYAAMAYLSVRRRRHARVDTRLGLFRSGLCEYGGDGRGYQAQSGLDGGAPEVAPEGHQALRPVHSGDIPAALIRAAIRRRA